MPIHLDVINLSVEHKLTVTPQETSENFRKSEKR